MTGRGRGTFDDEKAEQIEGLVIKGFEIVWVGSPVRMVDRYWAMYIFAKRKIASFSGKCACMCWLN